MAAHRGPRGRVGLGWSGWIFPAALFVAACGGGGQPAVPTQNLVDFFDHPDTEVIDSPQITAQPRALWRFGDAAVDNPLRGWTAEGGVADLRATSGGLRGVSTSDRPILHVEWEDSGDLDDRLRSVEVELRATGGTNLEVELRDADDELEDLSTGDWDLSTPIIPGDDSRTYTITNDGNIDASDIRHVFIRPTDAEGVEFSIASVRLLFDREYLVETPSGVGWHGLAEIYRESLVAKAPETIRIPLTLPERPWLDVSIGTFEEGAVTFTVTVTPADGSQAPLLARTVTTPERWHAAPLELDAFAGQSVTLSLSLDSARAGAIGLWGSPVVRSHGSAPPGQAATLSSTAPQGVILIMADTIRSDHLAAYGYGRETTPALSRLASEGSLFLDAISQATWTKVSTPSILTSLYPASHTVKDVPDRLPSSATTIAEVFRAAGYATISFSSVTFSGQSTNLHQGFEVVHEAGSRTGDKRGKSAREYVDRLIPWLQAHRDVPFFAFVHVFDPHSPFEPRPPYDTMWADPAKRERHLEQLATVREQMANSFLASQGMPNREELAAAGVDEDEFISYHHDWYDGSIRGMDTEIGRILEQLQQLGLTDRTLVAFVGDHGEEFLEHGRTWHGQSVYGELTNVPLVLRQPGVIPAGRRVTETVRTIDLMPTILALSGLPIPEAAQGQTLTPLLAASSSSTGPSGWVNRPAVSEEHARLGAFEDDQHESFALVLDGWRLIHNAKVAEDDTGPEFELYHHETDPLSLDDVAEQNPDLVEHLGKELERWRQRADVARLQSDEELSSTLSADELKRLRSLGYLR